MYSDIDAACIVIFGQDSLVYGLMRNPPISGPALLGGKVEPGETPAEAAIREAYEESGWVVKIINPLVFISATPSGGLCYTFEGELVEKTGWPSGREGTAMWIHKDSLLSGPYGDYNKKMFSYFGRS